MIKQFKNCIRLTFSLLTGVFLSVLAGDLLYLYYAGGWYDPIKFIEVSEIVILYLLFVWGIAWMVMKVRDSLNDKL